MSFLCFRISSDFPFGLKVKFQILSQASTQVCVCPLASFSNTSPYAHLPFLRLHALGFFPCALYPFPVMRIPFSQIWTPHPFRLSTNVTFSEKLSLMVLPLRSSFHTVPTSGRALNYIITLYVRVYLSHQTLCSHCRARLHIRAAAHW